MGMYQPSLSFERQKVSFPNWEKAVLHQAWIDA